MSSLESSAASPIDPAPSPALAGQLAVQPRFAAAQSRWQSFFLWLGGSLLVSTATAWLAFQLRLTGRAPEVLFPIGVGVALGFALAAVVRFSGLPSGRWPLAATILWGLLVVLGQEYFAHLAHQRNYFDVQNRANVSAIARLAVGEIPPPGFAADLRVDIRDRGAWAWNFDALATVLAAAVVVAWCGRASRIAAGPTDSRQPGPLRPADPQQFSEVS